MSGEPTRPDAPNQQVVRSDGSAPWDEGTGGAAVPKQHAEKASTDKRSSKARHAEDAPTGDT